MLFCAIRLNEVLGTLSFTRDTRAAYEMALFMRTVGFWMFDNRDLCMNAPALVLELSGNPRRFASLPYCPIGVFEKAPPKVRNKSQDRLHAGEQ